MGLLDRLDVAGVRHEATKRAEMTADDECRTFHDRFLVIQPNLEGTQWKIFGGLDGPGGALVDKVLTETADALGDLPDGVTADVSWRKATALVNLCVSDEAPPANVSVFVDASRAGASEGRAGIVLETGPKVGRTALEAILCNAETEVIVRTDDGRYLDYGRRSRTVTPTLRRALLDRYGHRCGADGCESRYRLEAHPRRPGPEAGVPTRTTS